MPIWNRNSSGGWTQSSGTSSSSSSSSSSGGSSSSSSKSYTYTRSDGTTGTTTDYRHSDAAKAADAANRAASSGSSSSSSSSSGGSSSSGNKYAGTVSIGNDTGTVSLSDSNGGISKNIDKNVSAVVDNAGGSLRADSGSSSSVSSSPTTVTRKATVNIPTAITTNTNVQNTDNTTNYESFSALFPNAKTTENKNYKILVGTTPTANGLVSVAIPMSEREKILNNNNLTWGNKMSELAKQSDITPVEQFFTDFVISPIATTTETFLFDADGNFKPVTTNPILAGTSLAKDIILGDGIGKIEDTKNKVTNAFDNFVTAKTQREKAESEFNLSGSYYEPLYNDDGTLKYSAEEVQKQAFDDYENNIRNEAIHDAIWGIVGADVSGIGGRLAEYEEKQGTGLERVFDAAATALLPVGVGAGTVAAAKGASVLPKAAKAYVQGAKIITPKVAEGAKVTAKIGENIAIRANAGKHAAKIAAQNEADILGISLRQTGRNALKSTNYLTSSYMLSDNSMSNEDKLIAMGSSLVFGAALGAGTKILSRGLVKETTSMPHKLSKFATSPVFNIPEKTVKKVQPFAEKYIGKTFGKKVSNFAGKATTALTTPVGLPLTIMGTNYAIDAGSRIITSDNPFGTAADIYASEIIPMAAGGVFAYKKLGDFYDSKDDFNLVKDIAKHNAEFHNAHLKEGDKKTTVKKEAKKYIEEHTKPSTAGDPFIALHRNAVLQEDNLGKMFDENRYTENPVNAPKGYKQTNPRTLEQEIAKQANEGWDIGFHVDEDGRWLDTPDDVVIRDSESEIAGLYIAPRPQFHYSHVQTESRDIHPSFFPTFKADARPSVTGVFYKKAYVPEIFSDLHSNSLGEYRQKHGKDVTRIGSEDWKIVNDALAAERDTKPYEERVISPHIKREGERIIQPSVVIEDYGHWRELPEFYIYKGKRLPIKMRKTSEYKYGVKNEKGEYDIIVDEEAFNRIVAENTIEMDNNAYLKRKSDFEKRRGKKESLASIADIKLHDVTASSVKASLQTAKQNAKSNRASKSSDNSYYESSGKGLYMGNVLAAGSFYSDNLNYNYYDSVNPLTMVSSSYYAKNDEKTYYAPVKSTSSSYYSVAPKDKNEYGTPKNKDEYYNRYPKKDETPTYIYSGYANDEYRYSPFEPYKYGKKTKDKKYIRRKNEKALRKTDVYTQFLHPFNFLGVDVASDLTELDWIGAKSKGYHYDELKALNKKWNKNTLKPPKMLEDMFGIRTDIRYNKPKKTKKSRKYKK